MLFIFLSALFNIIVLTTEERLKFQHPIDKNVAGYYIVQTENPFKETQKNREISVSVPDQEQNAENLIVHAKNIVHNAPKKRKYKIIYKERYRIHKQNATGNVANTNNNGASTKDFSSIKYVVKNPTTDKANVKLNDEKQAELNKLNSVSSIINQNIEDSANDTSLLHTNTTTGVDFGERRNNSANYKLYNVNKDDQNKDAFSLSREEYNSKIDIKDHSDIEFDESFDGSKKNLQTLNAKNDLTIQIQNNQSVKEPIETSILEKYYDPGGSSLSVKSSYNNLDDVDIRQMQNITSNLQNINVDLMDSSDNNSRKNQKLSKKNTNSTEFITFNVLNGGLKNQTQTNTQRHNAKQTSKVKFVSANPYLFFEQNKTNVSPNLNSKLFNLDGDYKFNTMETMNREKLLGKNVYGDNNEYYYDANGQGLNNTESVFKIKKQQPNYGHNQDIFYKLDNYFRKHSDNNNAYTLETNSKPVISDGLTDVKKSFQSGNLDWFLSHLYTERNKQVTPYKEDTIEYTTKSYPIENNVPLIQNQDSSKLLRKLSYEDDIVETKINGMNDSNDFEETQSLIGDIRNAKHINLNSETSIKNNQMNEEKPQKDLVAGTGKNIAFPYEFNYYLPAMCQTAKDNLLEFWKMLAQFSKANVNNIDVKKLHLMVDMFAKLNEAKRLHIPVEKVIEGIAKNLGNNKNNTENDHIIDDFSNTRRGYDSAKRNDKNVKGLNVDTPNNLLRSLKNVISFEKEQIPDIDSLHDFVDINDSNFKNNVLGLNRYREQNNPELNYNKFMESIEHSTENSEKNANNFYDPMILDYNMTLADVVTNSNLNYDDSEGNNPSRKEKYVDNFDNVQPFPENLNKPKIGTGEQETNRDVGNFLPKPNFLEYKQQELELPANSHAQVTIIRDSDESSVITNHPHANPDISDFNKNKIKYLHRLTQESPKDSKKLNRILKSNKNKEKEIPIDNTYYPQDNYAFRRTDKNDYDEKYVVDSKEPEDIYKYEVPRRKSFEKSITDTDESEKDETIEGKSIKKEPTAIMKIIEPRLDDVDDSSQNIGKTDVEYDSLPDDDIESFFSRMTKGFKYERIRDEPVNNIRYTSPNNVKPEFIEMCKECQKKAYNRFVERLMLFIRRYIDRNSNSGPSKCRNKFLIT